MSWSTGDQITASKLNSENHVVTWSKSWTAPNSNNDNHTIGNHTFYYHDGLGSNNPSVIEWYAKTVDEKYWGDWYSPWITMWVEKRTAAGAKIGSRYTIISAAHGDVTKSGNLTRDELANEFGSAEGWYYLYYDCRDDKHGDANMWFKAYGFPTNNKVDKPLRYFDSPSSSGHATPNTIELTASILNTHRVGTYE